MNTTENGLDCIADPVADNNAGHMVLWTKQSFEGDVKIDFDFTRLDSESANAILLYIQATGSGTAPYVKDISAWADVRQVASMKTYFNHMNLYHISFSAYEKNAAGLQDDYIRARWYMPDAGKGLEGTSLKPDYLQTGMFTPGVLHHITVIKQERILWMLIRREGAEPGIRDALLFRETKTCR